MIWGEELEWREVSDQEGLRLVKAPGAASRARVASAETRLRGWVARRSLIRARVGATALV